MDSLTQVVLGAAVGEAVLGKKVGNRAMVWGAVAGTIPDLDVYMRAFLDNVSATEMHRGITHSLLFSIGMAFVLGWSVYKYPRQSMIAFFAILAAFPVIFGLHWGVIMGALALFAGVSYLVWTRPPKASEATKRNWIWLFFWALVTHPLLDAHTTWGTQFFWPFDLRLAYKNIFVVDPLYTLPFLFFLLLAVFRRKENPKRAMYNWIGIGVSSLYMLLSLVFKGVAFSEFDAQLKAQKIAYVEMDTRPTPFNTMLWNAQVETKTGFRMGYYSLFDSKNIVFSEEFPKNYHLIAPYKDQKVIQQLVHISDGWYIIQEEEGKLFFVDIRFGQAGFELDDPFIWKFELVPDANGKINAEKIETDMTKVGALGSALWGRMWGN